MTESPFIPFYTSDFLGGTSGMTSATKGVYITLLCLMYETEGPLTQAWDTLARRSGCTLPAFKKAVETLEDDGKITCTDAGIWSEKCEKHIAQRRERSKSAKAAAKTRWEKTKENQGEADADAMQPQCKPKPKPYRDTNVSHTKRAKPERFQEFWDQYPHRNGAKKGRADSEKRYARHIAAGVPEQNIISGAIRYASDRKVLEGFAKDPSTWLNKKGWEDEIEPVGTDRRGNHPRASSPHDSLLAGFAAFANSDDDAEGRDFGGGYGPDDTGGETMDSRSGGYASQPVLRLIGAN